MAAGEQGARRAESGFSVEWDAARLARALTNLVGNALDHSPSAPHAHPDTIDVTSSEAEGTTFRVHLPRR